MVGMGVGVGGREAGRWVGLEGGLSLVGGGRGFEACVVRDRCWCGLLVVEREWWNDARLERLAGCYAVSRG